MGVHIIRFLLDWQKGWNCYIFVKNLLLLLRQRNL